jgi:hypothetical protein
VTIFVVVSLMVAGAWQVLLRKVSPPLQTALWYPFAVLWARLLRWPDLAFLFVGLLQFPALGAIFLMCARRWNAARALLTILLLHGAAAIIAYRIAAR